MKALTVVMPAYNEEGAIRDAVAEVQSAVLDRIDEAVLVVVNDGSRDATGAILDELAASDPRVTAVHKDNGGHGPAIITGLEHADSEWVFLVDSDLQMPLDAVTQLWAAVHDGHEAAFGVRRHRDEPRIRLLLTRMVRATIPLLFGVRILDANVPYKLVRRSTWEDARAHIPPDTLAPSLFLAVFMKLRGLPIAEIDVEHRERTTGVVSIRRWKLIRFCSKAFAQMIDFRRSVRS